MLCAVCGQDKSFMGTPHICSDCWNYNSKLEETFEEEFEDEAVMGTHYDLSESKDLIYLAGKYNLVGKVKIKAKDGKIVIERVE